MEVCKMGKGTKYKPSMGLAFNEENEMKMLGEMAKQGWKFYSYRWLGYKFKKAEPEDLIYCVDFHKVKKDEREQYFSLFEAAGWNHVCSAENAYHYFSALPGTKPIYTDKETLSEKYNKGIKDTVKGTAVVIIIFFLSKLLTRGIERVWRNEILSIILDMITGGAFGLIIAFIITGIVLKIKAGKLQ
jgi:hypothetical protein